MIASVRGIVDFVSPSKQVAVALPEPTGRPGGDYVFDVSVRDYSAGLPPTKPTVPDPVGRTFVMAVLDPSVALKLANEQRLSAAAPRIDPPEAYCRLAAACLRGTVTPTMVDGFPVPNSFHVSVPANDLLARLPSFEGRDPPGSLFSSVVPRTPEAVAPGVGVVWAFLDTSVAGVPATHGTTMGFLNLAKNAVADFVLADPLDHVFTPVVFVPEPFDLDSDGHDNVVEIGQTGATSLAVVDAGKNGADRDGDGLASHADPDDASWGHLNVSLVSPPAIGYLCNAAGAAGATGAPVGALAGALSGVPSPCVNRDLPATGLCRPLGVTEEYPGLCQSLEPFGGEFWGGVRDVRFTATDRFGRGKAIVVDFVAEASIDLGATYRAVGRLDGVSFETGTPTESRALSIPMDTRSFVDTDKALIRVVANVRSGPTETEPSRYFMVDNTVPVTDDNTDSSWHTEDVTVTLTVSAGGSPTKTHHAKWKVDEDNPVACKLAQAPELVEGTQVTINADGYWCIAYRSADAAGNVEATKIARNRVKLDKTDPVSTRTVAPDAPDGKNGWYVTKPVVTLAATDGFSGVSKIEYRFDNEARKTYADPVEIPETDNDGIVFKHRATDVAGNEETEQTHTIKVDLTAPDGSSTVSPTAPNGDDGWYRKADPAPKVTLTATDTRSRIERIDWTMTADGRVTTGTIDGGGQESKSGDVTLAEGASVVVSYASENKAGLVDTRSTPTFKVDLTAPRSAHAIRAPDEGGWYIAAPDLTLTATDALSGVRQIDWKVLSGEKEVRSGTIAGSSGVVAALPDGDEVRVTFKARDVAGNVGDEQTTAILKIDSHRITIAPVSPVPGATLKESNATIRAKLSVPTSGIDLGSIELVVSGKTIPPGEYTKLENGWINYSIDRWDEALRNGENSAELRVKSGTGRAYVLPASAWTFTVDATDSDKDGYPNAYEISRGSDPYDPYSWELDKDGDCIPDGVEEQYVQLTWDRFVEAPAGAPGCPALPTNPSWTPSVPNPQSGRTPYASAQSVASWATWAPPRAPDPASLRSIALYDYRFVSGPEIHTYRDRHTAVRVDRVAPDEFCLTVDLDVVSREKLFNLDLSRFGAGIPTVGVRTNDSAEPVRSGGPVCARLAQGESVDADNDAFPDAVEGLLQTDPTDPQSYPGSAALARDGRVVVVSFERSVEAAGAATVVLPVGERYAARVHLLDAATGAPLETAGRGFELALLDAADGPAAPAKVAFRASCPAVGPCTAGVTFHADGSVEVTIPTRSVPVGPFRARATVGDAVGFHLAGKDSAASGFPGTVLADAADSAATPVLLVSDAGHYARQLLDSAANRPDQLGARVLNEADHDDDGYTTALELQQGSDPLDATSTPETDDDGDRCPNKSERVTGVPAPANPEWLVRADAIPNSCVAG